MGAKRLYSLQVGTVAAERELGREAAFLGQPLPRAANLSQAMDAALISA
jgi:hypothetical protein